MTAQPAAYLFVARPGGTLSRRVQIDTGDLAQGRRDAHTARAGHSLGLAIHGNNTGQRRDGGADDSRVVSGCGTVNGAVRAPRPCVS